MHRPDAKKKRGWGSQKAAHSQQNDSKIEKAKNSQVTLGREVPSHTERMMKREEVIVWITPPIIQNNPMNKWELEYAIKRFEVFRLLEF